MGTETNPPPFTVWVEVPAMSRAAATPAVTPRVFRFGTRFAILRTTDQQE